jgi:hypothetical protein
VKRPGTRTAIKAVLYTSVGLLMIMGTAVLVTFNGEA